MSKDPGRTEFTERIKAYARSFSPWEDIGADMVGVIAAESLDAVPSYWVGWEINARKLVRWLRRRDHAARIAGDLLPKKRMAQLAGFGGYGKNSLIIHPRYGPWLRLQAVLTDAELETDEPYQGDPCGDCDECVKSCPVGALTPYVVDPDKCLAGPHDGEWVGLLSGRVGYGSIREGAPGLDEVFDVHSPRFTANTRLICMTCQKACPIGREERGL